VTIGGGTGSFTVLSGLKEYDFDISAIVSMADDGGSTGRLRDELGVLPPGDIRQCLVALSKESQLLRNLFNYRFESGELKGHSLGNLFLSASEKMTGSFVEGLKAAAKALNIKGKVLPVTAQDVNLFIKLNNGKLLKGEDEVNHNAEIEEIGISEIYLKPKAKPNLEAIEKIKQADLVVIGPGNHYCSIIPNLVIKEIAQAISESKGRVVYICNLVNKRGHTENFDLDDYVNSINSFFPRPSVDLVIYNSKKPTEKLRKKYEKQGESLVQFNPEKRNKRDYKVYLSNILSGVKPKYSKADAISTVRSLIRHNSKKIAKVINCLINLEEYKNIIKEAK